jgi:4-phytase/acid phosphatase
MRSLLISAIGTIAAAAILVPGIVANAANVDKVVIVMRHGVRPPADDKEIAPLTAKPWPDFGVAAGMLTRHGAEAAGKLGAWEGKWLAWRGVLAAPACPREGEIFAWSSRALQRTTDTGIAFLDGMFPRCGVKVGKASGAGPDPLFMASETDVGRLDLAAGKAAILAAAGGNFDVPKARLAELHGDLQRVMECCKVDICEKLAGKSACELKDLDWRIVPSSGGRNLSISGPMALAATVSQIFLLEYAQGFPPDKVAWGLAATKDDVLRFSEMRKIKYEYFERVPYIARHGASNILAQLTQSLVQGTGVEAGLKVAGPPDAKYVLYVGSDTQIAEIGAILDVHWQPRSYLADETPPTGGLVFERLVDPVTNARSVRVSFITPTLDQIRDASTLDDNNPPEVLPLTVPDCASAMQGDACPLSRFGEIVHSRIDMTAIAEPDYR